MTETMAPAGLPGFKTLAASQIAVGAAFSLLLAWLWNPSLGASFAVGALLMLTNMLLIAWTLWRLLMKKSIAWTSLIIVIKYAVLFGSIVLVARASWFSSLGAGLGITSFLIAALLAAIVSQQKKENY
jgi:hypothetical protein